MAAIRSVKNTILPALAFVIFLSTSHYAYGLINYDNHPDLTKAMEFDSEKNGGDKKKADRSKSEYHYLRYLGDVKEPFQKARVYSQLGSMYAVSFNAQKGEKRNYQKAREYYRKVLEFEPERIDGCIIEARNMLITFENPYGFEQLKARVAMYKWLSEIDEKKLKENWLPQRPPSKTAPKVELITNDKGEVVAKITRKPPADTNVPSPQTVIGLMNLIKDVKYGAIYNATYWDTISMPVSEIGWAYILEHLPDDALERKIVEEAKRKKTARIADEALKDVLDSLLPDSGEADRSFHSDVPDSNEASQPLAEIVVKQRFVPHIDFAIKDGTPFIFDLKSSRSVNAPVKDKLDSEEVLNYLMKLGKGDIAWNGSILTTRKAQLFAVSQEAKRPFKYIAGKYSGNYKLPDKVQVPYTLLTSTKEGGHYLIKIVKIAPEGITIIYRKLSRAEVPRYLPRKINK